MFDTVSDVPLNIGWARGLATKQREYLSATDLDVPGVEPRRGDGEVQKLECIVAILGERAHRAVNRVTLRRKPHLDRLALQAIRKSGGIKVAGAGIEQRSRKRRGTGFAGRVLNRATDEGKFDRDQRNRPLVHQPRLDTARAYHAFDRRRPGRGREHDACCCDRCREVNHAHHSHDRFSSDCKVLTR